MVNQATEPPILELPGARLRPVRPTDVDAFETYLRDPATTERTAYPEISRPFVVSMTERWSSRWAAGELSKWALANLPDDQLIGTCGFNEWSPAHRWAELAYDLAPAYWGKGLMYQAVVAVLQWAFQQNDVERVHAYVRVDNERSFHLLERCGFQREGCLRQFRVCRGQRHDFYIYGLLRADA